MKEFLAFITFLVTEPHSGNQTSFTTEVPTNCAHVSQRVTAELEADGFLVNTYCHYTHAPATSQRPIARPVRVEA